VEGGDPFLIHYFKSDGGLNRHLNATFYPFCPISAVHFNWNKLDIMVGPACFQSQIPVFSKVDFHFP
jgi:hypothetical protein